MKTAGTQGDSVGVAGVSGVTTVGEWGTAANGGTPAPLSGESALPGSLDHLNGGGPLTSMVARPTDRITAPHRCDCADYLRTVAEDAANSSRDFGRGFMWAARLLAERAAA